ncbi:DUF366 family protein [bacterium]|nr:DUF366 family protein [bacterium]
MRYIILNETHKFTGIEEIKPHWALEKFGLVGDSIVAFSGPCNIKPEYFVDIVAAKRGKEIFSKNMLHIVVEHFDTDIEKAILKQMLLISIIQEKLENRITERTILRWGDDLFDENCKLTTSAVIKTLISTKIYVGINISSEGTPIKTRGLEDYGIDPFELIEAVINQYRVEIKQLTEKSCRIKAIY